MEAALATGYRHVDTAAAYANEREVGEAIRRSGVDRAEIFIETKVWISDYGYEQTLHAFDKSAGKLGVEQIDLLILHQALPSAFDRTLDAYRALEKLLADGKVRAIGVSNFMPEHLDRLLRGDRGGAGGQPGRAAPLLHPARRAGGRRRARDPDPGVVADRGHHLLPRRRAGSTFDDPTIAGIAKEHDKTPAQVMLRWHLQPGARSSRSPPAGADRRELRRLRLRAHAEQSEALDALDTGVRGGPEPEAVTLETFGARSPRPDTTPASTATADSDAWRAPRRRSADCWTPRRRDRDIAGPTTPASHQIRRAVS